MKKIFKKFISEYRADILIAFMLFTFSLIILVDTSTINGENLMNFLVKFLSGYSI